MFPLMSGVGMYATFIVKLDPAGSFLWAKAFTGTGGAYCFGMAMGADANLRLAGNLSGTVDFDPGGGIANLTAAGQSDVYVAKINSSGGFIWARSFGGATHDMADGLAVDSAGSVHVTGSFQGTADFDPGLGIFSLTAGGSSDAFVTKLDVDGNLVWARQLGGAGSLVEVPTGVGLDGAGNVHVAGHFVGTADFDPGAGTFPLTSTPDGGDDVFATALDGAGGFLWAARMGGSCAGAACLCCGDDRARGMAVDPAGHTYTVGIFRGRGDWDPSGNTDFFLTSQGMADDLFISRLSPVAVSGVVPDGASAPGAMLTVEKGAGTNLIWRWGASCRAADARYGLYEGTLGSFTSHVPMTCNIFQTSHSRTPSAGDRYYLVVPSEGTVDGSYGVDGDGNARVPSAAACHPQSFSRCVP
jgi:hypothetical protein